MRRRGNSARLLWDFLSTFFPPQPSTLAPPTPHPPPQPRSRNGRQRNAPHRPGEAPGHRHLPELPLRRWRGSPRSYVLSSTSFRPPLTSHASRQHHSWRVRPLSSFGGQPDSLLRGFIDACENLPGVLRRGVGGGWRLEEVLTVDGEVLLVLLRQAAGGREDLDRTRTFGSQTANSDSQAPHG